MGRAYSLDLRERVVGAVSVDEKETAVAGRLRNIKNSENVFSRKLLASRQLNGSLHGLHRSAQCPGVIEGTSPSWYRNN